MPLLDPTLTRIAALVHECTGCDIRRISSSTVWDDIGADSLARACIFSACESEFKCELPDSKCEVLNTIGELSALVDECRGRVGA